MQLGNRRLGGRTYYGDFGDDFAPFEPVGCAVLVFHQALKEVVEFFAGASVAALLNGRQYRSSLH